VRAGAVGELAGGKSLAVTIEKVPGESGKAKGKHANIAGACLPSSTESDL
jgi:hypothetical protein